MIILVGSARRRMPPSPRRAMACRVQLAGDTNQSSNEACQVTSTHCPLRPSTVQHDELTNAQQPHTRGRSQQLLHPQCTLVPPPGTLLVVVARYADAWCVIWPRHTTTGSTLAPLSSSCQRTNHLRLFPCTSTDSHARGHGKVSATDGREGAARHARNREAREHARR